MQGRINFNGMVHFFLGLMSSRLSGPLLGVVAVCSLLWFAGHLVGLAERQHRLLAMGTVLLVCVLVMTARWLWAKRSGNRLVSELASHNAGSEGEIEEIQNKMQQALSALKASYLGAGYRGNAALYALPWYMIIGPSATGKSTLFANSGLHFPYENQNDMHIQGFGGTRNCDWWFSEQAVLIDTAGRYATESADRQEWLAFLQLLKKHRPKLPINGVLVAFSISDILTAEQAGIERHAKQVRERLEELIKQLGIIFPVYVMFTKCDLISGFEPFFSELDEPGRQQLWGAYLLDENNGQAAEPAELFSEKMTALYRRLCGMRLGKLAREPELQRKRLIIDFPNQFRAVTAKLTDFIALLSKQNPYQELPWFAGVYFTSGTQEGTPVEHLDSGERHAFGVVRHAQKQQTITRSYFIYQVFNQVMFRMRNLTRGNRRQRRWQRWLKGAHIAAGLLLIGISLVGLMASYQANLSLLAEGEQRVAAVRNNVPAGVASDNGFPQLLALFAHYQQLQEYERQRPWYFRLGIYQGDKTLTTVAAVLHQQLEEAVRRPAREAMVSRLTALQSAWIQAEEESGRHELRADYYQTLKLYLLLSGDFKHWQSAEVEAAFFEFWSGLATTEGGGPSRAGLEADGRAMLGYYLSLLYQSGSGKKAPVAVWPREMALVDKARQLLQTRPEPQLLYRQIINGKIAEQQSLTINNLLGSEQGGVLHSALSVPYAYTARGWHQSVKPELQRVVTLATRGDWVMATAQSASGEARSFQELQQAIRELYFKDYARHWLAFLGGIKAKPFAGLSQASRALSLLSSSEGPLAVLMSRLQEHISLTESAGGDPLRSVDALSPVTDNLLPGGRRVAELEHRFADLRRFTRAADEGRLSDFLQQYLRSLSAVHTDIQALATSHNPQGQALAFARGLLDGEEGHLGLQASWIIVESQLRALEPQTKRALESLFKSPLAATFHSVMAVTRERIDEAWNNQVYGLYASGLKGKFPFNRQGSDASPDDVAELLNRRSGSLWQFVEQQLRPFLRQRQGKWHERQWNELGIGLSPALLRGLDRARQVSRSLFGSDSEQAAFEFLVSPVPQGHLKEAFLGFSDQSYRYRNEPEEWRKFAWPGQGAVEQARVYGISSHGERLGIVRDGPWAFLRIINEATVKWVRGNEYLVVWQLGEAGSGMRISFSLRSGRHSNIFNRHTLTAFSLPQHLFVPGTVPVGSTVAAISDKTTQ